MKRPINILFYLRTNFRIKPVGAPVPLEAWRTALQQWRLIPLKEHLACIALIGEKRSAFKHYIQRSVKASLDRHKLLRDLPGVNIFDFLKRTEYAISVCLSATPAIARLEAAAATDCGLILTARSLIKNYFAETSVCSVSPHKINSVSLQSAIYVSAVSVLRQHVMQKYTASRRVEIQGKEDWERFIITRTILFHL